MTEPRLPHDYARCAGKPTNNPPGPPPGVWEFYQPCHNCLRRTSPGHSMRQSWQAVPEFIDGQCPRRILK
jgi:hypothetical protein